MLTKRNNTRAFPLRNRGRWKRRESVRHARVVLLFFNAAMTSESGFVDAKIGAASCLLNLVFIHQKEDRSGSRDLGQSAALAESGAIGGARESAPSMGAGLHPLVQPTRTGRRGL